MPSFITRLRLRGRRTVVGATAPHGGSWAYDQLMEELPDEDLAEDLADTLDLYRTGSKPEPDEAEYLELIQDAVDRMAREG
jgi:hypothetical protein